MNPYSRAVSRAICVVTLAGAGLAATPPTSAVGDPAACRAVITVGDGDDVVTAVGLASWGAPTVGPIEDAHIFTLTDGNGDGNFDLSDDDDIYGFWVNGDRDPQEASFSATLTRDWQGSARLSADSDGVVTARFPGEAGLVPVATGAAFDRRAGRVMPVAINDYAFYTDATGNPASAAPWVVVPTEGSDCSDIIPAPQEPPVTPDPPYIAEPVLTIDGGPADGTTVTEAPTYSFYANSDSGTTSKECRIDEGAWATCSSPYTVPVADLPDGSHRLDIRAVAYRGYSPVVSRTFVLDAQPDVPEEPVDTTAPVVTFGADTVDGASYDTAPTFDFTSTDTDLAGYECSIDGSEFRTCSSPLTPDTAPGTHTLAVRATDTTGNTSTPVSTTWALRDVACDDARAGLREARAARSDARARLDAAIASGKQHRIDKLRTRLREARAAVATAKADVAEHC